MSKSKRVSFEAFYEATGKASAAWQMVEDAICDVFTRAVICSIAGSMLNTPPRSALLVGGIFYSSTNLRARLDMVTQILDQLKLSAELAKEWNTIENKTNDLYKRRNIIAHGHVWGNEQGASSVMASLLNFKARSSMTYDQVCACEQSFKRLAERTTKFAIALNKALVS